MVISYLGGECFKVTQGELTLAFNLPAKESKLKSVKFGSDIVFVSLDHPDFSGTDAAAFGEREPFVISGPGEYEVQGVAVVSNRTTPSLPRQVAVKACPTARRMALKLLILYIASCSKV